MAEEETEVKLLVEKQGEHLLVSEMNLKPEEAVYLVHLIVNKFSELSGIEHNEILEDLKIEEK